MAAPPRVTWWMFDFRCLVCCLRDNLWLPWKKDNEYSIVKIPLKCHTRSDIITMFYRQKSKRFWKVWITSVVGEVKAPSLLADLARCQTLSGSLRKRKVKQSDSRWDDRVPGSFWLAKFCTLQRTRCDGLFCQTMIGRQSVSLIWSLTGGSLSLAEDSHQVVMVIVCNTVVQCT